jgi:aryl-alcohol dehydrogenase-like predicted oxidoreductase
MKIRKLGSLEVSALGLGCMGMLYAYGPTDESESLAVMRRYFERGGNFLDTAEICGPYKNEELLAGSPREIA